MNKLDLIETLKSETGLTKKEAMAVVYLFFDEMANALPMEIGLKSVVYAHFTSRNINHIPAGIPKPVNK
jgi:nucleoid DNA-binding protein